MARLKRSLKPDEVVVELAGKQQQQFYFNALGAAFRGTGSNKVGDTSLPGVLLAFDFAKKTVRIVEPLLYADGLPKAVPPVGLEQFTRPEHTYDVLTSEQFATLVRDVQGCIADGNAKLIQGAFPEA